MIPNFPSPPQAPDRKPRSAFWQRLAAGVQFALGWIWFHRRVWLGAVLVAGVGGWLYFLSQDGSQPETTGGLGSVESPTARLQLDPPVRDRATDDSPTEDEPQRSSTDAADAFLDDERLNSEQPSEPEPASTAGASLERLLNSGTKEELIAESLELEQTWRTQSPSIAASGLNDRVEILRKLMAFPLSDTERVYVLSGYIDSLSVLNALNSKHRLGIRGLSPALEEVDQKYGDHADVAVAAKAQLATLLIPGFEYSRTGDANDLNRFREQFERRVEVIARDPQTVHRLVRFLVSLLRDGTDDSAKRNLLESSYVRLSELKTDRWGTVLEPLAEEYYLHRVGLESLVRRIQTGNGTADEEVERLFRGLEAYPDFRIELYGIAGGAIRAYQLVYNRPRAAELTDRLRQIQGTIADPKQRELVGKILLKLDPPEASQSPDEAKQGRSAELR